MKLVDFTAENIKKCDFFCKSDFFVGGKEGLKNFFMAPLYIFFSFYTSKKYPKYPKHEKKKFSGGKNFFKPHWIFGNISEYRHSF